MIFDLQKASMWKRISAFLFDSIILGILVAGLAFCLSSLLGYDGYRQQLDQRYQIYENQYQVDFDLSMTQFEQLGEQELANLEQASAALSQDADAVHAYTMMMNLTLVITSFSILFGFLILEFFVPLWLKNGQTLGKKIFSIAVMRTDGVKVSTIQMFIRTILGKYTVETMIPVLVAILVFFGNMGIYGTALILGLGLLQLVLLAATRTNSLIHDLLARTVVVDMPSQMIFESEEAMVEYKKRIHAENTARQQY